MNLNKGTKDYISNSISTGHLERESQQLVKEGIKGKEYFSKQSPLTESF
jgi:hypothetical protein